MSGFVFLLFAAVAWGQTCQRQYGGVCVPSSSSSSEPACCSPDLQCLRHASSCTGDNVEVFRCAKRGGSVDVTFLCLLCFSSLSFFVFFFFFVFVFFVFLFFFVLSHVLKTSCCGYIVLHVCVAIIFLSV